MKKQFVRTLARILVLVMILSAIPMAALAEEEGIAIVVNGIFNSRRANSHSFEGFGPDFFETLAVGDKDVVVKTDGYEKMITADGEYYDLVGVHSLETLNGGKTAGKTVTLKAFNSMTFEEWYANYGAVILAYVPHEHKAWNDEWFFSLTNHWQYCELCKEVFNMNWHHDKDENDICDDCQQAIHYYDITVAETTGGKVEVSADKARLNDRVDVTITPDSGYKVKSIAFYNNNEQHSQVCQYMDVPYSEYHFIVLPWDVEVVVEFEAE